MTDCGTPNEPNCEYKFFLTLEFEFKRMFMSVFFTSYLPAMVMVILGGMATFIDPKSSPARVTLGITTVLTISTVIQGVKTLLPQVNYLTALDVYLWVCFFFVCITLIEYVYEMMLKLKKSIMETLPKIYSKFESVNLSFHLSFHILTLVFS